MLIRLLLRLLAQSVLTICISRLTATAIHFCLNIGFGFLGCLRVSVVFCFTLFRFTFCKSFHISFIIFIVFLHILYICFYFIFHFFYLTRLAHLLYPFPVSQYGVGLLFCLLQNQLHSLCFCFCFVFFSTKCTSLLRHWFASFLVLAIELCFFFFAFSNRFCSASLQQLLLTK